MRDIGSGKGLCCINLCRERESFHIRAQLEPPSSGPVAKMLAEIVLLVASTSIFNHGADVAAEEKNDTNNSHQNVRAPRPPCVTAFHRPVPQSREKRKVARNPTRCQLAHKQETAGKTFCSMSLKALARMPLGA